MKATKKKSIISKLMAVCLTFVFVLSMSMSVFAVDLTEGSTSTITVTGTADDAGATINAYKLINVNYDYANDQLVEPVYQWTDTMADWLSAHDTYKTYIDTTNSNSVTAAYMDLTAGTLNTFYKAVVEAGILTAADATGTIAENAGVYKAELTVGMGDYLVTATAADGKTATYQPMHAAIMPDFSGDAVTLVPAEVALKGSLVPDIDKEGETEDGDQTVAVGDTVNYTVTAGIPSYPEDATATRFVVGDKLSAGLTLTDNSIAVKAGDASLTANTHYTLTDKSDGTGDGFEIEFDYAKLKEDFATATQVTVTYTAVVNENAFEVDALGNKAYLGYNTNPYDDGSYDPGTDIEEEMYTFGINLNKEDKETSAKLADVEFQLKDDQGTVLKFRNDNGTYIYDPQGTETTLTTNANGAIALGGIDAGTYKLVETKAHNGYVLPKGEITVVLADANSDGVLDNSSSVTYNEGDVMTVTGTTTANIMTINVTNTNSDDEGFDLPVTGGMGTALFTIAGIILMAGAATMVVVISKKKRA